MPASPRGLPGATSSPCSRCTRRTTAMSRARRAAGRRRAACSRRSPARAGASRRGGTGRRAARSVRPCDPTLVDASVMRRGQRTRSHDAARSSTGSWEPMATIVRVDLVDGAQQRHLDLGAGVVALHLGGDDEQPVGAHQRGEHARAPRQRRWPRARRGRARAARGPSHPCRSPRPACGQSGLAPSGVPCAVAPSSAAITGPAKMSNVSDADTG